VNSGEGPIASYYPGPLRTAGRGRESFSSAIFPSSLRAREKDSRPRSLSTCSKLPSPAPDHPAIILQSPGGALGGARPARRIFRRS
jgi:hypothetical protein